MSLFDDLDLDKEKKIREDAKVTPGTAPGQSKFGSLFDTLDKDEDELDISAGGGLFDNIPNRPAPKTPFSQPPTMPGMFPSQPQNNSPFGGAPTPGPFGGVPPVGGPFGQQQQPEPEKDFVDIGLDLGKKGAHGLLRGAKSIRELASEATPFTWNTFGKYLMGLGGVIAAFGLLFTFITTKNTFALFGPGTMLAIAGVLLYGFTNEKAEREKLDAYEAMKNNMQEEIPQTDVLDLDFGNEVEGEESILDFEDEEVDLFGLDEEDDTDELSEDDLINNLMDQMDEPEDHDDIIESIEKDRYGLYSKEALYEKVIVALEHHTPNFTEQSELSTTSQEFILYAAQIRSITDLINLPAGVELDVTRVTKGFVTDTVYTKRPKGTSDSVMQRFNEELTNLLAYESGSTFNDKIYTNTVAVGVMWITTVTKGTNDMVTIKDALQTEKDFMVDPDNTLPILLGYAPNGDILKTDFKDIESSFITGMPRSGKTWFVKTILGQLTLFHSPEEVIIYIADTKAAGSDYYNFRTPHVKVFASEIKAIMDMLEYLVTTEADIRNNKLAKAGVKNIWDYNKKMHDSPMPVLYVVIDEMVALATHPDLTTDDKKKYNNYLQQLVTKLPSIGVRLIGLPHVLKHDILNKTTIEMVSFKASVGGDVDHIQQTTGASKRDFPYTLTEKGDIALKANMMKGDLQVNKVEFCRAFVLGTSNSSIDGIFDFSKKLWMKLAPDTVPGSLADELDIFGTE